MKKKIVVLSFVVSALVFLFGQVSFAQDMEGKIGLGARVAFVDYAEDEYDVNGVEVDTDPDDAAMVGIDLTYFIDRYFSFELCVGYAETDVELSALGLSGDAGEITQIPVLLSGRVHFSTNPKVNPYLAFGGGYFFNDIDSNRGTIEFIYGPGAEVDVDNSFGYHLGGGIEFFISEKSAVNLDFKYIWTEVEAEVNVPGFAEEEFEINPFVAGLGIKYYF